MTDLAFIESLDQKTRYEHEMIRPAPNMSGRQYDPLDTYMAKSFVDGFVLKKKDLLRVMYILQDNHADFCMVPCNRCMGFCVAYQVFHIELINGVPPEGRVILEFSEQQSASVGWSRWKKVFLSGKNIERLKFIGMHKPSDHKSTYEY